MNEEKRTEHEPTITFGESAAGAVVNAFGWAVAETGMIMDGLDPARSFHGGPVYIGEFAGVVEKDGEPVALRDNFCDIADYAKYRRETEAITQ